MKLGDKVVFHGPSSRYGDEPWLEPGAEGVVVEIHPAIEGTGVIWGYDEDGEPQIDMGMEAWAVGLFPGGCRRVVTNKDSQQGR